MITAETKLYGSFAEKAGSTGCKFFNAAFKRQGIDAIYKSFSVSNIQDALLAMRILNIKGAGVTMPYKREALMHVDTMTNEAALIGAANTIINDGGYLHAENTDYMAVRDFLEQLGIDRLVILGNGGYARAVKYACELLDIDTTIITRSNWESIRALRDTTVFNCTPVENIFHDHTVQFIDCLTWTVTGKHLAHAQGKYQFKLYTGRQYIDN